jgi:hypothetical protein
MRTRIILALVAALALAGCHKRHREAPPDDIADSAQTAAPATDADTPQAFLTGLYAHYKTSKTDTFEPFGANKAEVFDADTVALMDEDAKVLKGELGEVDGDLLCDCQDFVSLQSQVAVQSATPTAAEATADVHDVGMPGMDPRHIQFKLSKTNGVWRIHDIKADSQDWLRQMLATEVKSVKAGGPRVPDPGEAP